MSYELSRQASAEIDSILQYTSEWFGDEQALEYVGGLEHSFELLADNPRLGRVWRSGTRRYIYRMHIVFYQIIDGGELGKDRVFIATLINSHQMTQE